MHAISRVHKQEHWLNDADLSYWIFKNNINDITQRYNTRREAAKATRRDLYGHIMQHYASRMQNISLPSYIISA